MGIVVTAAIIVGLPRKDFTEEELDGFLDTGQLSVCPPYYNGDGDEEAIVGLYYEKSDRYTATALDWNEADVNVLCEKFKELTDKEPEIFLSPLVY